MSLLDYLFIEPCRICGSLIDPKNITKTVCKTCWGPIWCEEARIDHCKYKEASQIMVAHAAAYEKSAKLLIHKLKYDSDRLIAADLSLILEKALYKLLTSISISTPLTLVPIPLSRLRFLKRGFNQADLLATNLSKTASVPIDRSALKRIRDTAAQHRLNRLERVENLRSAFSFRSNQHLQSGTYVIVDDIHTSGSTLAEAARTLFESGVQQVAAITVARAMLD